VRTARLFLMLTALFLLVFPASADPTSHSLWRDLVRSYEKGVREEDADARRVAAEGLKKVREVKRDSDGALVKVDTKAFPSTANRETKLFGAQLKELAEAKTRPAGADPAKQAKEILARPEFTDATGGRSKKSALERWLEDVFKKISKWLEGLRPPGLGRGNPDAIVGFAETMRYFLYFLGGVGVLVLGYHLVRAARDAGWFRWQRKKKKTSAEDDPLLDASIVDPLREARAAEQAGEWRQAVRLLYIAALRVLRERGWLVLEANRTNWEYQRLLTQRAPELARLLLPATRRFDRIWYGKRMATAEDAAAMHSCVAALDAATRQEGTE
jgi:hypothetical protein